MKVEQINNLRQKRPSLRKGQPHIPIKTMTTQSETLINTISYKKLKTSINAIPIKQPP